MELCASTITKSERLIRTLQEQEIDQIEPQIAKKNAIIETCQRENDNLQAQLDSLLEKVSVPLFPQNLSFGIVLMNCV